MNLKNKNVITLGAGSSGRAAATLALSAGADVSVHDASNDVSALPSGIVAVPSATEATGDSSRCDVLVVSPGIDGNSDFVKSYQQHAGEMIGEVELAYRFYNGQIIAITGTNGKTTTTEIVDRILNHCGVTCLPCGNYGQPFSELPMMDEPPSVAALEVSSFQLETVVDFHPDVVIWLNFSEDHMDRYATLQAYKDAKLRVFENLGSNGVLINVARGSVVDQDELIYSLKNDVILAAGLDVYVNEPNIPKELIDLKNTVLLPHVASATVETRNSMGQLVFDNIKNYFEDKPLISPVV